MRFRCVGADILELIDAGGRQLRARPRAEVARASKYVKLFEFVGAEAAGVGDYVKHFELIGALTDADVR